MVTVPAMQAKNYHWVEHKMSRSGWKVCRQIVKFDVLLTGCKSCKFCGLGSFSLTRYSIVSELQR